VFFLLFIKLPVSYKRPLVEIYSLFFERQHISQYERKLMIQATDKAEKNQLDRQPLGQEASKQAATRTGD
jgi:hypothetical protein